MKKILLIVSIIIVIITSIDIFVNYDRICLDGFEGEILSILCITDTEYSQEYTHSKFSKIITGMTSKKVLDILGEPLARWIPHDKESRSENNKYINYQYSQSPGSTHYRLRQVRFRNDTVYKISACFWVD